MDYYQLATLSLIFQLGVLALLFAGYGFKRRLSFHIHGLCMLAALVIHLIFIGVIMMPSLLSLIPFVSNSPTSLISFISLFHAIAGSITAILSIWIVGTWRLRHSTKFCASKRKHMRFTFTIWSISLFLGVILYFILYW
jgi:uncharacterized membrane protein YozB (DUF420 family)